MHPGKALLVKVELQNMLDAKFIETIAYSEWVLNPLIILSLMGISKFVPILGMLIRLALRMISLY